MSDAEYIKYLEKVLAATGGNVYWLDKNCVYQGCNDNVAHMLGLKSGKDIAGLTDRDLHHFGRWGIEQAQSFLADDLEVIRTGKPKSSVEEPIIFDKNGQPVFFYTTRTPIFDDNGEIIGIVGTSTDITSLKKAQKDLMLAKQQAEAANRAKTEFLANMSHDMLSPLAGILLAAESINQNTELPEEVSRMSSMISAAGNQIKRLFTSCLDLSKLEMEEWASVKSVFPIHQIVQNIYDLYLPKAVGSGLSLSVFCDPNLPEAVEGHQDSLFRALLNLTGNALKFTQNGGVTIRAMRGEQIDKERTTIVLEVEDTGMGIPKDKFKIIFEKLQRLNPSYSSNIEGSGIGLYIVDQFIRRMGGNIHVESEVGKGSKFTVSIPMLIARPTFD